MAKANKKPAAKAAASKSTSKTTSKSAAKSAKAGAKSAAGTAKAASSHAKASTAKSTPLVKTLGKVVGKILGKDKDDAKASAGKVAKTPTPAAAAKAAKPDAKAGKVAKAGKKKGKKEVEDDDELLVQDDDLGSEEIPDLSEFDAEESETAEDEASLETADETEEAPAEASAQQTPANDDEVVLTDAEGRRYCRVRDCDQASAVEGYCRYHYLLLWKRIQVRRKILTDGKLERYVDELTSRYPDKFLEMIRKDLKTEKDFLTAIAELEIDESAVDNEFEDEAQSYIDEVRGLSTESNMTEEEEF